MKRKDRMKLMAFACDGVLGGIKIGEQLMNKKELLNIVKLANEMLDEQLSRLEDKYEDAGLSIDVDSTTTCTIVKIHLRVNCIVKYSTRKSAISEYFALEEIFTISNAVRLAGIQPNAKKVEAIIEKMDRLDEE